MGLGGKEQVNVGIGRELPDRDRSEDREDRVAASVSRTAAAAAVAGC